MKDHDSLTPVEFLDKILSYMSNDEVLEEYASIPIIKSNMRDKGIFISVSEQLLGKAIEKLDRDGYLTKTTWSGGTIAYTISFEGQAFVQEGGYKAKMDASEVQIKQARNSYWVTVSIGLSTGISAVYYSLQLYDGAPTSHKCVALGVIPVCLLCIGILVAIERYKALK